MNTKLVQFDQITIHSESFGSPDDPPVLLIMGAMASGVWWPDAFCSDLASRSRFVIRYDHRDTGASTCYPVGESPYSVEGLADDAIRVIDAYSLDEVHLVGMSLGGYLAQIVALKQPRRVPTITLIASERLALADPELMGMDPSVGEYHAAAAGLDWSDRPSVVEYQVGAWRLLSGSAHEFDEAFVRRLAGADFDRTSDMRHAFNHASLGDADAWVGRLSEITQPVLIIHGTEDPILPYAHALALQRDLPNPRLVTLAGSGHELHRADWPTILKAIDDHTSLPSTSSTDADRGP